MPNKVKYNLKNVHVAKYTGKTNGTFQYETPVAIPGAVSLNLSAEGENNPFYADGIVYYRSTANNGYNGDLEMALIPTGFARKSSGRRRTATAFWWKRPPRPSPSTSRSCSSSTGM